jgi:hypothetical protein
MEGAELEVLEALQPAASFNHTSYRVAIMVPCHVRTANLTQKWLRLSSSANPNLAEVHALILRPLMISAVRRSRGEHASALGEPNDLSISVDRPWDLSVLAAAHGADLVCSFHDILLATQTLASFDDGPFSCQTPVGVSDLQLHLALKSAQGTNRLTTSPILIIRSDIDVPIAATSSSSASTTNTWHVTLSSSRELVYGQQARFEVILDLHTEVSGELSGIRCLLRAQGLPIVVFDAKLIESGAAQAGSEGAQASCAPAPQLQSRLETAKVRSIELALAGQGPGPSTAGLQWISITIRARVIIKHGFPVDLTLIPGQRHKVTLWGEFQTLVISSTELNKDVTLWVRLKYGGASDLFKVRDVREDSLSFEIPGEMVAAGAEHHLELGYTPSIEEGPRVLALSPFKITLSAHLPIVDFQPRVALTSSLRETPVTLEVLQPPAQGRSLACAQRRSSSNLPFIWSPAVSIAPQRYKCLLEDGRAGAHELGLGY